MDPSQPSKKARLSGDDADVGRRPIHVRIRVHVLSTTVDVPRDSLCRHSTVMADALGLEPGADRITAPLPSSFRAGSLPLLCACLASLPDVRRHLRAHPLAARADLHDAAEMLGIHCVQEGVQQDIRELVMSGSCGLTHILRAGFRADALMPLAAEADARLEVVCLTLDQLEALVQDEPFYLLLFDYFPPQAEDGKEAEEDEHEGEGYFESAYIVGDCSRVLALSMTDGLASGRNKQLVHNLRKHARKAKCTGVIAFDLPEPAGDGDCVRLEPAHPGTWIGIDCEFLNEADHEGENEVLQAKSLRDLVVDRHMEPLVPLMVGSGDATRMGMVVGSSGRVLWRASNVLVDHEKMTCVGEGGTV